MDTNNIFITIQEWSRFGCEVGSDAANYTAGVCSQAQMINDLFPGFANVAYLISYVDPVQNVLTLIGYDDSNCINVITASQFAIHTGLFACTIASVIWSYDQTNPGTRRSTSTQTETKGVELL